MTPTGIIAVDFDHTLLRSDGSVSARTNAALNAAADAGWLIVGATGRPLPIAEPVSAMVPSMTHLVTGNGSLTIACADGAVIEEITCAEDIARLAGSTVREHVPDASMAIDLVDGGQIWEPGFDVRVPTPPLGDTVDDVTAHIRGPVRKLLVWSDERSLEELRDVLTPLLQHQLELSHSGLDFLELGPHGISKASALERLADIADVAVENRVAFGDARNDHEMLQWAAIGVAMDNADDETKARADDVTLSNDADGIADWIEQKILNYQ